MRHSIRVVRSRLTSIDSPVTLVSADMGESRASARAWRHVVDLHNMVLKLRNGSGRRIRGLTMIVSAAGSDPGGKGSGPFPESTSLR